MSNGTKVVKRDGNIEHLNLDKIHIMVENACDGLAGVDSRQAQEGPRSRSRPFVPLRSSPAIPAGDCDAGCKGPYGLPQLNARSRHAIQDRPESRARAAGA